MARRLLAKDIPLVVYDRDAAKVKHLLAAGAEGAADAMEVAERCDRTICMVENTAQVLEVLLGFKGIRAGAAHGHRIACMTPPSAAAPSLH